METIKACMDIIWQCRLSGTLRFWALENPVGFLRQFLGVPRFTFKQWEFGGSYVKPTDIWGYFNEPKRTVKTCPEKITERRGMRVNSIDWTTPKAPEWLDTKGLTRADLRAITPGGFAEAFFRVNT
jgi:hypothetical protein